MTATWDGEEYQARFDRLAASGASVHGEAELVASFEPASVLDAGCGSGRVAIELHRRGITVVGADADPSMIDAATRRGPDITWVESNLAELSLDRTFDLVVMAGNVPLFTAPGTQRALVAGCARHLASGGRMLTGFSLGRGYGLDRFDADCAAAGLELAMRWSTWSCEPFLDRSDYAVSVHVPTKVDTG